MEHSAMVFVVNFQCPVNACNRPARVRNRSGRHSHCMSLCRLCHAHCMYNHVDTCRYVTQTLRYSVTHTISHFVLSVALSLYVTLSLKLYVALPSQTCRFVTHTVCRSVTHTPYDCRSVTRTICRFATHMLSLVLYYHPLCHAYCVSLSATQSHFSL